MPDTTPLQFGRKFGYGRFVLHRFLGRGGMGEVWLAQDERLHEPVALKFLPPEIRGDPAALDDLRRETARSHKLTHPNIVRIHDLHEEQDGTAFIVMEYVDGLTLAALRLRQPKRVMAWHILQPSVEQLCAALAYAHGEKVIHRDLKPANLMLDGKGRLKLADFGIAASASDSMSRITVKNATGGTLPYMSPQQLAGKGPRATDDIYALGATLYELLTSKLPFYTGDLTHQILHEPAEPMAERLAVLDIENAIPSDVSAMVMACLAKEPDQRPQSAGAVAGWIGLESARLASVEALNASTFSSTKAENVVDLTKGMVLPSGFRPQHEPVETPSSRSGGILGTLEKVMSRMFFLFLCLILVTSLVLGVILMVPALKSTIHSITSPETDSRNVDEVYKPRKPAAGAPARVVNSAATKTQSDPAVTPVVQTTTAPARAGSFTLSQADLLALDINYNEYYLVPPSVVTVVAKRAVRGQGVEFDIRFPNNHFSTNTSIIWCSSIRHGSGSLTQADISRYDSFALDFTLLSVNGKTRPGSGGPLIVGAVINPANAQFAFRPGTIGFSPYAPINRTVSITKTDARTISAVGFTAEIPDWWYSNNPSSNPWGTNGSLVTLLVKPAAGAILLPHDPGHPQQ